jgi:heat shock protein HslJ
MKRIFIFFALVTSIVLLHNTVSASGPQKKTTMSQEERLNDSWVLQELDGKPVDPKMFPSGFPSLQFVTSKDKVTGFGGCNRINAPIKVKKNSLSIGEMAGTKMACPGEGEDIFLENLEKVSAYKIDGALMELKSGEEVLMIFHRYEEKLHGTKN